LTLSTVAIAMSVAFYFDSRVSWMTFFGYTAIIAGTRLLRLRDLIAGCLVFGLLFAAFMPDPTENLAAFADELVQTSEALWNPSKSDVGRNLQWKAGWMTLTRSATTFLIGTGVYSHRFAILPA